MGKSSTRSSARERMVSELLRALSEREDQMAAAVGGYPGEVFLVDEPTIVISRVEDSEPVCSCIPLSDALDRYGRARRALAAGEFEDIGEAMWENDL